MELETGVAVASSEDAGVIDSVVFVLMIGPGSLGALHPFRNAAVGAGCQSSHPSPFGGHLTFTEQGRQPTPALPTRTSFIRIGAQPASPCLNRRRALRMGWMLF